MNEDLQLMANRWYEGAQAVGFSVDAYASIRLALKEFVGEGVAGGIAIEGDEPIVIAIKESTFITVRAREIESEWRGEVTSRPLDVPAGLTVSSTRASGPGGNVKLSDWRLEIPGFDDLRFQTRTPSFNSFTEDLGGEAVMNEVARHLGLGVGSETD